MATFVDLGCTQPIPAQPDTTGQNAGNLTTVVDLSQISVDLGQFNIWHMVLTSLTLTAQASVYLNTRPFGGFGPATGTNREWFGNIFMRPGDTLAFYWNLVSTFTPVPVLTVYMMYDRDLPANTSYNR